MLVATSLLAISSGARADETGSAAPSPAPAATAPRPADGAPGGVASPAPLVSAEQERLLRESPYVYISSTRKDNTPSRKAEIWFFWRDGSIWVGTRPDSWRAKRIRWKRPMATIWIGSSDGPAIRARGEFVTDPSRYAMLCDAYATKYPERWPKWEKSFRDGLASGERVLIRYIPVAEPVGR